MILFGVGLIKRLIKGGPGQNADYFSATFWPISPELDEIQKRYTYQMKDLAFSFQMAGLNSL